MTRRDPKVGTAHAEIEQGFLLKPSKKRKRLQEWWKHMKALLKTPLSSDPATCSHLCFLYFYSIA